MEDVDGVIGRLMELMEDAHIAMGKSGCREDSIAEIILGDHLRTREGEENTSWLDFLQRLHIQSCISLEGIVESAAVLGKCGRVEDYEVVVASSLVEIFEGILAESLVALITGEIEFDILGGEFDGLGTAVNGVHECGTASHGIERESARVAEHVEHTLA